MNTLAARDAGGEASAERPRLLALDPRHGWRRSETACGTLYATGDRVAELALSPLLGAGRLPTADAMTTAVSSVRGLWAIVIDGPAGVAAAVDHVRSLPLFHADGPAGPIIGDDARAVAAAAGKQSHDPIAIEELALAGYATGGRTRIQGLVQLAAGEVAVWPKDRAASRARHHEYRPPDAEGMPLVSTAEHGTAVDAAFDRLVARADGRPIWVPISGGLDSRLVLAKLVERAYRPLSAFSYGPRRNSDAEIGRLVAERLGVAWRFVSTPGPQIRAFFESPERRDYWRFADGLASLPSMQDVNPLAALKREGALPADAMIVNGNTGDFISGGHIAPRLLSGKPATPQQLLDAIVDKHFVLWRPLLTQERRRTVQTRIAASLGIDPSGPPMTATAAASIYERFEYAERQAKFVVNGQRSYEWHGLAWHLPLWDRDIVDLFARAPLSDRAGQSLYRRYLHEWDYRGVFSGVNQRVTAWPRLTSALLAPIATGLRVAVGRARRDRMFRYLNYFDRFGDHYKAFGFREFARHAQRARNPAALYTRIWLRENGIQLEELAGA